jgi:multimeric flavodoxin WrbA
MSKVIVVYDSKTGFTEQMAKAVVEGAKGVKGVDVELIKVGTPFSISKLNEADALIFGSPTRYGGVTQEMGFFLENIEAHKESKRLNFSGKIGGVFASYEWDGGWVAEKIKSNMEALGIQVVEPPVSLADGMHGKYGMQIGQEAIQKCLDLGKAIAEKAAGTT